MFSFSPASGPIRKVKLTFTAIGVMIFIIFSWIILPNELLAIKVIWTAAILLWQVVVYFLVGIKAYMLSPSEFIIEHHFTKRRYRLSQLKDVKFGVDLSENPIRLPQFKGDWFGLHPLYYNDRLGKFKKYVSEPGPMIALYFDHETAVISPQDPQAFLETLETVIGS